MDETGGVDGADSGSGADDRDDGPEISDESRDALDGGDNDNDSDRADEDRGSDDTGAATGDGGDDGAGEDADDDDTAAEEAAASQDRLEAEGREAQAHIEDQMGHGPDAGVADPDATEETAVEADLEAGMAELTAEIEALDYDIHDPSVFNEAVTEIMDGTTSPELQEHIAAVAVEQTLSQYEHETFFEPSHALGDLIETQTSTGTRDMVADAIVDWSETAYDAGQTDPLGNINESVHGYAGGMRDMPNAREALSAAYAERAAGQTGGFADVALDRALTLDVVTAARNLPGEAARITEAMSDTFHFGSSHRQLSQDLYEAIDAGVIAGGDARGLIEGTLDHTIAMDDLSGLLDTGIVGRESYRDALAGAMAKAYDVGSPDTAELRQELATRAINAQFDAYLETNPTTRMQLAAAWNDPGQAVVGAGKNFVNGIVGLAELGAAGVLHLGAYNGDTYQAVADFAGFDAAADVLELQAAGLRSAAAGIDWQPFELTGHAQQGGAIVGTVVELGTGIAGLARASTMTVARNADEFASTSAVAVTGTRAIDRAQGYEQAIRGLYAGADHAERAFEVLENGEWVTRYADDVAEIGGLNTAVDAKYVDDWAASPRNPESPIANLPFAVAERETMITQARNYANGFEGGAIYHTNSVELAEHYSDAFRAAGIDNIEFIVTPSRLE